MVVNREDKTMESIQILGVDLAKRTFATCGADKNCYVKLPCPKFQTSLSEMPCCIISTDAFGSVHHWARVAQAAVQEVRLIPAHYV